MSSRTAGRTNVGPVAQAESPAEIQIPADPAGRSEESAHHRWDLVFFTLATLMGLLLVVRLFYISFPHDHYVYLAESFAQGRLDVDQLPPNYIDTVTWQGHRYFPFGPLPAVLLIPFLPLLNAGMDLGAVAVLLTVLNIWLFSRVLGRININSERRNWALLLFFAGTNYFAAVLVPTSTWFAHVVVVSCVLLAIHEAVGGRRAVLVGLFLGLAAMTRLTAAFSLPFFVWWLWHNSSDEATAPQPRATRLRNIVLLGAGLAGPLALLLLYNYARFGSFTESGYNLALLGSATLEQARAAGLFSLVHVPKNLFMLLLQGPIPYPSENAPTLQFPYVSFSRWGMGLFFISPALVFAFRASLKRRFVQACWLGIGAVLAPLLTYYGVGWYQFGFRYALDFLPFMLLLAAIGFKSAPMRWERVLVTASVLVNLWGALWLISWM